MAKFSTKRAKACDITKSVKEAVWQRDKGRCIICMSPFAMPSCHYVPRSKGGLGIEQNIVTLCQRCHEMTDHSEHRQFMLEKIERYLKNHYPDWDKEKVVYKKWQ